MSVKCEEGQTLGRLREDLLGLASGSLLRLLVGIGSCNTDERTGKTHAFRPHT
jgi:hypothetical protein